jgi:ElaB/YqjD/DUF883 family membrane-anchored ribosome-binding protein
MELYYKDFISEEASLEKLVEDLMLVVQGAEELAQAASVDLESDVKAELTTRLQRLKDRCRRMEAQAIAGTQAAGRLVRRYPYTTAGFAFGLGLVAGAMLARRKCED